MLSISPPRSGSFNAVRNKLLQRTGGNRQLAPLMASLAVEIGRVQDVPALNSSKHPRLGQQDVGASSSLGPPATHLLQRARPSNTEVITTSANPAVEPSVVASPSAVASPSVVEATSASASKVEQYKEDRTRRKVTRLFSLKSIPWIPLKCRNHVQRAGECNMTLERLLERMGIKTPASTVLRRKFYAARSFDAVTAAAATAAAAAVDVLPSGLPDSALEIWRPIDENQTIRCDLHI